MGFHGWDDEPEYEWDPGKARINDRRHHVTFVEAATVMEDPHAMSEPDDRHGRVDERWLSIGWSALGRLLAVVTSERGPRPRIISARRATKRERDVYSRRRRSRS